jgi:HAMP domain-containing protein
MENEQRSAGKSSPNGAQIDARPILAALRAVQRGDFDARLPLDQIGVAGEVAEAFNNVMESLSGSTDEIARVSEVVGKEGKISQRASLPGVSGGWARRMDSLNLLIGDLVQPIVEVSRVIGAVAQGDLSKHMSLDFDGTPLQGESLQIARTVNTMVDQLSSFAAEVTRVAREVRTDGKLGGQAEVVGVAGTWKDLTESVNLMAANLTGQVRNIAAITTAVAKGDLSQKITAEAMGEILQLKQTINTMVDQLSSFASEVTRVAREVGTDGKLGGQASVPGAAGTWKDLTDNVNQLAANLTTQVRAIAEVAKAVTKGDLTRSSGVAAQGEVEQLKDNINEMIRNLRETTQKNTEQDWLKTNLAKFTRMLQGQKDLQAVSKLILSELAAVINAQHGVFYLWKGPTTIPSSGSRAPMPTRSERTSGTCSSWARAWWASAPWRSSGSLSPMCRRITCISIPAWAKAYR